MQTREINHKTNLLHHPEANSLLELIEHTKDAIVLCDANREIVSWNKGAEKMFGYTKAEVMHKIPLDLGLLTLSPEEISELDTSLFTSETWNGIKVFTTKQGEKIYGTITANAIKNESGGLNSVLFIVKDDTKKKEYTEKLKKNNSHLKNKLIEFEDKIHAGEHLLHLFIKHTPAAIAMFDLQMNYLAASQNWIKKFNMPAGRFIGHCHYDFFPHINEEVKEAHQRSLSGEVVKNEEFLYKSPTGNEYWHRWETHPWHTATGEIGGIVIFIEDITNKKLTESFITKSEEQYKNLIERISDGFIAVDTSWRVTFINRTAEEILRQPEGYLLGKQFWNEFPETVGKSFYNAYHKALAQQEHVFIEDYSILAGKWVQVNVYPSPTGLSVFFKDISKEKEAELKAKKNTDLLNLTLTSALDAMVYTNKEGKIINWNKQAEMMFGWKADEIIGSSICETIVPERYKEELLVLQEDGKKHCPWPEVNKLIEITVLTKVGDEFPCELFVASLQEESETIYCAFIRDISDRKKNEEEIIKSHAQLKEAQEFAHVGYWELDPITQQSNWSDEAYRIFGIEPGSLNMTVPELLNLVHPEDLSSLVKQIEKLEKTHKSSLLYHRILRKNGEVRYVYTNVNFKMNHSGVLVLVYGVTHDVTELKKLEMEMQEQKKKENRKLLAATMDAQERERKIIGEELHDNVNQILVATELYLSSIATRSPNTKELLSKCIQNIQNVIRENRKISHELVQPDFDDQSLVEKITSLSNSMLKDAGINITIQKSRINEEQIDKKLKLAIYRIFQEQYTNIIKHSKATSVSVSFHNDKEALKIRITDDGKGTNQDQLTDGIGLKNIKSRLSLYDGKATISTAPGKGFTLQLNIPLSLT